MVKGDQYMDQEAAEDICVTVHGTFASKATWIDHDSAFGSALKSRCGATVKPFRWSGKNSEQARLGAARGLREHINKVAREHEGANITLVGHSHGGNVIRYALDRDTSQLVRQSIFLGTPFVNMEPRNLRALQRIFQVLSIVGAVFIAVLSIGVVTQISHLGSELAYTFNQAPKPSREAPPFAAVPWFIAAVLVSIIGIATRLALIAAPYLRRKQKTMLRSLCPVGSARRSDLILYAPLDEAAGIIRFGDVISNACARLARHLSRVTISAIRAHKWLRWAIALGIAHVAIVTSLFPDYQWLAAPAGVIFLIYLAVLLTFLSTTLAMPLILAIGYLCALPVRAATYGWNGFLAYLLFTTTVDRAPRRREAKKTVLLALKLKRPLLGLAHSVFYDDPEVQRIVAHAMSETDYRSSIASDRAPPTGFKRPLPRAWSRYFLLVMLYGAMSFLVWSEVSFRLAMLLFMEFWMRAPGGGLP